MVRFNKAGSKKMADTITITAGIDTSKDKLDVAIHGTTRWFTVENRRTGWQQLAEEFAKAGVQRVGIEATGGYERGVTRHLQAAGFTMVVLQPLQAKAFARLHLRRAKNDRIDAALIAACTQAVGDPRIKPDQRLEALADHLTFVEQIEEDIARFKTRLEHIQDKRLHRIAVTDITRLERRRATELKRIVERLQGHDDLAKRFDLVRSVPGIGERTAVALIVRMPELGRISREEAAALAGLAPFDDDSGQHKGERHIAGGRGRLRRSLYAAALPAAFRWNPALIDLYVRLTARGKTHKAALVACARKLLIFANAVVERGSPWLQNRIPG
jgi:transposase